MATVMSGQLRAIVVNQILQPKQAYKGMVPGGEPIDITQRSVSKGRKFK